MDRSPPGTSVHGDSPGKNTGVGCYALLQGNLPNKGIKPRYPALQMNSLLSEPPGKPKNTGVCILSPCLFNLYAEYTMRNAGLEEAQAGIKIGGRNINNLRYVDDTTLMAESEELMFLLM